MTRANQILKGGPYRFTWNGVFLLTTKDTPKFLINGGVKEQKVPGEPGVFRVVRSGKGQAMEVTIKGFRDWDPDQLNLLNPALNLVGGVNEVGQCGGGDITSSVTGLLVAHPVCMDNEALPNIYDWVQTAAFNDAPYEWEGMDEDFEEAEFHFVSAQDPTETLGTSKKILGYIGDASDATVPARTSTVPADTTTGVAIGTTVVVKIDIDMPYYNLVDGSGQGRMLLYDATAHTLVDGTTVITTVTKRNDTITFTPDVDLDASTTYEVILPRGIRSQYGVEHAGSGTWFTTA